MRSLTGTQVEYIARLVEEPDMDRDDKIGGIRGMLEGVVDGVRAI